LGIHPGHGASHEGVPFINISGQFLLEITSSGYADRRTFQWSDNFTTTIGRHDLKFSGDIRYQRFDQTAVLRRERSMFLFRRRPEHQVWQSISQLPLGVSDEYGQGSAQSAGSQ
jgi:hypothetical protein